MPKDIVKDSVKEVLQKERLSLYLELMPTVTNKEMQEIVRICGKPSYYDAKKYIEIINYQYP